jgi:aminopeptidase N
MTRTAVLALAALCTAPAALHAQALTQRAAYRPGIDVLDYHYAIDLPDTGDVIAARAALRVHRTARADTLVLDLLRLAVDSVLVNGRPAAYARDSATVRIALPRFAAPDTLDVAVRYGGRLAPRDGLIVTVDSVSRRWQAFADNWPDRGRNWLASVDHPSDKATVTWTVTAPSTRRVVANGSLVEETPLVGAPGRAPRTRTVWRESRPIPVYLMVIAAATMGRIELAPSACGRALGGGCVEQSVYFAPEVRAHMPGPFAHAPAIVDWLSRTVAPFPYEKLAHVQSSTIFGGMENASAIFYADRLFRTPTERASVVPHEIAHQWFGDAVTEREWGHLWLSEGFATYFEKLWLRRSEGDSAFRAGMADIRAKIAGSPVTADRPVIDTAQTNYLELLNTNSYEKGGWVLHMLRAEVGDSAFFRAVRGYYAAHKDGTALTDDLQRHVERAAARPLGWFFDQWLRRPGMAELRVGWTHDAATGRVTLSVRQGERFAPYRLRLAVDVARPGGTPERVVVSVPAQREARVPLPGRHATRPASLTFDPDVELLGTVEVVR